MIKKDIILGRLDELLLELKKNYKVKEIGLFGSVVGKNTKPAAILISLLSLRKVRIFLISQLLEFFLKTSSGQR
jgi:hypothetical protein